MPGAALVSGVPPVGVGEPEVAHGPVRAGSRVWDLRLWPGARSRPTRTSRAQSASCYRPPRRWSGWLLISSAMGRAICVAVPSSTASVHTAIARGRDGEFERGPGCGVESSETSRGRESSGALPPSSWRWSDSCCSRSSREDRPRVVQADLPPCRRQARLSHQRGQKHRPFRSSRFPASQWTSSDSDRGAGTHL